MEALSSNSLSTKPTEESTNPNDSGLPSGDEGNPEINNNPQNSGQPAKKKKKRTVSMRTAADEMDGSEDDGQQSVGPQLVTDPHTPLAQNDDALVARLATDDSLENLRSCEW